MILAITSAAWRSRPPSLLSSSAQRVPIGQPWRTTALLGHPQGQADACLSLHGRVPRLRRRLDRQRRLADDPARPALLGAEPAMGLERLPTHLRRGSSSPPPPPP